MAIKRIHKEYLALINNPEAYFTAGPIKTEDEYHWMASIMYPQNTPFSEGIFFLDIQIPFDYPFKPPKIVFKTPIYHPCINSNGQIDLDILVACWSPAWTITKGIS